MRKGQFSNKQDACWAFTPAILGVDVWVGGDWFLNNVCIYDNKQWAVGVLSDLCWNLRVFCPVGSLGTCKKVLGVRWRKRGVYQQVLNLRKGVGHPFVESQLGVGDDGVWTGNFYHKAGIAISKSSHVPGAARPPPAKNLQLGQSRWPHNKFNPATLLSCIEYSLLQI